MSTIIRQIGLGSLDEQLETYKQLHAEGLESIKLLKMGANMPSYNKEQKTYTLAEVERIINVPRSTIRDNRVLSKP